MSFQLCPLHERRDLTDECIRVINKEWPRSKALRLHSLEKSCNTLPYSLVMTEILQEVEKKERVVGYCRFVKVLSQKKSILIETVVVDKERRGQGLGKKLIELAENYAKVSGFHAIFVSTYDMMKFYERLGYQYCEPVNTIGAQMLENSAVSSGTNTPLSCDDFDEASDGTKGEASLKENDTTSADDVSHSSGQTCSSSQTEPHSFVVEKERRGQGLGRKLMELAESEALKSGYDTMYLCTYDKQTFYEHLGYQYCKPVNTLGAQMLESCACSTGCTNTPLPREDLDKTCQGTKEECPTNDSDVMENNDIDSTYSEPSLPVSPPPPPPPPPPPIAPAPVVYWLTKPLKVM